MNRYRIIKLMIFTSAFLFISLSCSDDKRPQETGQQSEHVEILSASEDSILFLSTQMNPIEEANIMRNIILKDFEESVDFQPNDNNYIYELISYEREADPTKSILFGGLHGDFYTLSERNMIEPVEDIYESLNKDSFISDFVEFGYVNSDNQFYIPWMQATYIMVINKKSLDYLPEGIDPFDMSYRELRIWVKKIFEETNEMKLGFPAGEKGLIHRFFQGYLYPSYTGSSPLEFNSHEAVGMWEDFRNLWNFVNPKSLFYMNMSNPLLNEEVWIAWDHTARLTKALNEKPDDFIAIPVPKGPEGRGYMTVLSGLGIPKGLENKDGAIALIKYLTSEKAQKTSFENTGFFPVLKSFDNEDISKPMKNLLNAVNLQSSSSDSLPTLLPIGLKGKSGEFNSIYIETFSKIVLAEGPIEEILQQMSIRIESIIDESGIQWW